jgi:hypothetical protein
VLCTPFFIAMGDVLGTMGLAQDIIVRLYLTASAAHEYAQRTRFTAR